MANYDHLTKPSTLRAEQHGAAVLPYDVENAWSSRILAIEGDSREPKGIILRDV